MCKFMRADIQDRDGAPDLLASIRSLYPWLRHVFADGGYAGDKLSDAMAALGQWTFEIIKRSDTAKHTLNFCPADGWSNEPSPGPAAADGSPRTSKPPSSSAVAWILIAHIRRLTRRLVQG